MSEFAEKEGGYKQKYQMEDIVDDGLVEQLQAQEERDRVAEIDQGELFDDEYKDEVRDLEMKELMRPSYRDRMAKEIKLINDAIEDPRDPRKKNWNAATDRMPSNSEGAVSQLDTSHQNRTNIGISYMTINLSIEKEIPDHSSFFYQDKNLPILQEPVGNVLPSQTIQPQPQVTQESKKPSKFAVIIEKSPIKIQEMKPTLAKPVLGKSQFNVKEDIADIKKRYRIEWRKRIMTQNMLATFQRIKSNQMPKKPTRSLIPNIGPGSLVNSPRKKDASSWDASSNVQAVELRINGQLNHELVSRRPPSSVFAKSHVLSHRKINSGPDDPLKEFVDQKFRKTKPMFNGVSPQEYYYKEYMKEVHGVDVDKEHVEQNMIGDQIIAKMPHKEPDYYDRQKKFLQKKYQYVVYKNKNKLTSQSKDQNDIMVSPPFLSDKRRPTEPAFKINSTRSVFSNTSTKFKSFAITKPKQ